MLPTNNKKGVSIKNVLFSTLWGETNVILQICFCSESAEGLSVGSVALRQPLIDLK